jgi:hypothetical protein
MRGFLSMLLPVNDPDDGQVGGPLLGGLRRALILGKLVQFLEDWRVHGHYAHTLEICGID